MENQSNNNQGSVKISEEPKKKLWTVIGVIILVLLVSTTLFIAYQNYMLRQALKNCKSLPDSLINKSEKPSQQGKLQVCPDEWYDNQMPPVEPGEQTQYFLIDGERKELSEFDLNWIEQNCNIEPQIIY